MEKLRLQPSIIRPHSRKIITQAEKIKQNVEKNLFIDEAPKRKLIEGITIDGPGTRDLDDGMWAEKTNFGYTLFISISDVGEYIKPNSILDEYSLKRPSSIYLNTHNYHMIPEILSTEILSLNNKEKTLTQTLEVNFDNDFRIINYQTIETIFYNKNRLTYKEFNKKINNPEEELYKTFQILYEISQALKSQRIKAGANPLFRECVSLKLDKNCSKKPLNIGQEIISEIAILKNMLDARYAYISQLPILYRGFKPELRDSLTLNINPDRGFFNYNPTYHSGFSSLFYTYNTSPIRRYADLINQRQFKSLLRKDKIIYNKSQIRKLAFKINTNIEKIIEASKKHNREVIEKRSQRLIKKLQVDNFENITSLPQKTFFHLLKYMINNENYLLEHPKIQAEIIFRIQNDLLGKKCISLLKSAPKNIIQIELFKEIIRQKENEELYY